MRLLSILWILIVLLQPAARVSAQEQTPPAPLGSIQLYPPQLDRFPTITMFVDAENAAGEFLSDLNAANLQVIENGRTLPSTAVTTQQNGLQILLVWNGGSTLGVTVDGLSEMERIRQAMQTWASQQPQDGPDVFSLLVPDGKNVVNRQDPQLLIDALAEMPPELTTQQPTLTSLADSLDLATDTLDDPLMKRVILFVTPPIPDINSEHLAELSGRAREARTTVHVWQVGPAVDPGIVVPLEQFALDTGGKFFPISPVDALPEIEPVFAPNRQIYKVEYDSSIRASGTQTLAVQAQIDGSVVTSNQQNLNFTLNPPNPIFLSPPAVIERQWNMVEDSTLPPSLEPGQVDLQVMLEFTDGLARPLTSTRLYVDGRVVAENTAEPFDQFVWDISSETATTRHTLRVEAVDVLGLTGSSVEIPVDLVIEPLAQNSLSSRISSQGIIAVAAMVVSGVALALVLVFTSTHRRGRWKRIRPDKKTLNDPLTQPVLVAPLPARKTKTRPIKEPLRSLTAEPVSTPPAARPPANGSAPARLVVLDENEQPVTGGVILLARQEITFGSEPQRAIQVLNSTTVDGLHARLYRTEEGHFWLTDQHSVAGTWVNFAAVPEDGVLLRHGDLIHMGRVVFRFELTNPALAPAAQITVTELETAR